jgi:ribosome biogenesis GTPase
MESLIDTYEMIGVRCFPISIKENNGLSVLDKLLKNKLTLFAGHSGTGKSTLMNKLHIDIDQKIGRVSEFANKGIHTTTFAEMFQVSENTYVIDTPGIKELGLIDIGDHELSDYFPEMRALLGECKFNNCSHTHEPKCSIIDAVEAGRIAMSRFNSYLSMLENEDTRR